MAIKGYQEGALVMEQSCHLNVVWFHEDMHGIKLHRTIYTHTNEIVKLRISKWALWIVSMAISCLWYCTLVCKLFPLQEVEWKAHRISLCIFFNFLGIHNNFKIRFLKKIKFPYAYGFISVLSILSYWFIRYLEANARLFYFIINFEVI